MFKIPQRSFSLSTLKRNFFTEIPLPKEPPAVAFTPKLTTTKCQHGTTIACLEAMGPTSSLIFRIPCGSRFETKENSGVAHYLKHSLLSYTTTRSPVAIAREIDLRGIQLNLALDREFLDIRANFERDDLEFVVDLIADVVQNTKFNHWEFELVQEKVKEEAEKVWKNSSKAAFELVHQLAFRDGLGNSTVAMPSHTIKNKDVVAFSQRYLGLSTASKWVGVGVNASTLTQLCESHFKSTLNPSHSKLVESKYKGGSQTRLDLPGPSHITLAFPAPALTNPMQIASYHSLKSLVQSTPSVKWGNKSFPLTEGPLLVFLTSYSDSGLFGLTSTSDDPEVCTSTIQTCIDQLRNIVSGKVNTSQIKKAISQAKFESIAETQMEKAVQLATGQSQVTEAFDKLTENDLVKTIETVLKTKPVLVAAGKTHALPHLDTFKF